MLELRELLSEVETIFKKRNGSGQKKSKADREI